MIITDCLIYITILVVVTATAAAATTTTDGSPKMLRIPINAVQQADSGRLRKRANSPVSLYNANGKEYLVEIGVGTPPQYFNVTLDTGSADCWIPSQSCPASMCPHARFSTQKSSTHQSTQQQMSISYGIGSAKGTYSTDVLTLGKASMHNFTIGLVSNTNNILMAEEQDSAPPSNGIFGLGFPGLSMKNGAKPGHFVVGLYEAKTISEPIFSIFLNTQSAYGKTGEMLLGGIDSTRYTGDMRYAPVISYDVSSYYISPNIGNNNNKKNNSSSQETYLYWSVPGQGVEVSNGYKNTTTDSLQDYILDTGTTLTYVPPSIAKAIVQSATQNAKTTKFDSINGVYTVSCSTAKLKGSVSFFISTSTKAVSTTPIKVQIPISELVMPLDDAPTADTAKSCMFGIAPSPTGLDLTSGETWILGESTLRSLYTVFDMKQNRVGIASLSTNSNSDNATRVNNSNNKTDNTSSSSDNNNKNNNDDTIEISTSSDGFTIVSSHITLLLPFLVAMTFGWIK